MLAFPPTPSIEDVDRTVLTEGHLWLLEHVDGEPLRFRRMPSGLIEFGTEGRVANDPSELPARYHHATFHVRDRLERDGLREALEDPAGVTFFGVATQKCAVAYDWANLPSFLGVDVHAADRTDPYPPDVAHAIFEEIGLVPLNPIEREVRPRDFDPSSDEPPHSAWYDGPAAGTLLRNKRGGRALVRHDITPAKEPETPIRVETLVEGLDVRLDSLVGNMESGGVSGTVEGLADRMLTAVWRTHHQALQDGRNDVDEARLRAACIDRARAYLEG